MKNIHYKSSEMHQHIAKLEAIRTSWENEKEVKPQLHGSGEMHQAEQNAMNQAEQMYQMLIELLDRTIEFLRNVDCSYEGADEGQAQNIYLHSMAQNNPFVNTNVFVEKQ